MPDKKQVAARFSRGARLYDQLTRVQKKMAARTAELIPAADIPDGPVMDIGAGTGELTRRVIKLLPGRPVTALDIAPGMAETARQNLSGTNARVICADAETADLGGPYALVVSSASFQWMNEPFALLKKIRGLLKPGGYLVFSTFGPATFAALRQAYFDAAQVTGCHHVTYQGLEFISAAQWHEELCRLFGHGAVWSDESMDKNYYPSARDFLKAVSGIGASTPQGGQATPGMLKKLMEIYERDHKTPLGVEVVYETLYFCAGPLEGL